MSEPTTVAIVEDDPRVREFVRNLIDGDAEFRCRGAYVSAEQALRGLGGLPADILLLDIHLPGMEGSDAVRLFHERFPEMRIVMFTVFDDDRRVFASLCNGAIGYVLKTTPPAKLLEALREARDGGAPMTSEIARRVVELFRRVRPRELAVDGLTTTERKVLALLAEGASYQSAAERMAISINTVRDHVRSIYEKLHVHSKSAAVSKALRAGIIGSAAALLLLFTSAAATAQSVTVGHLSGNVYGDRSADWSPDEDVRRLRTGGPRSTSPYGRAKATAGSFVTLSVVAP